MSHLRTRILMLLSAGFMAALGLITTFSPQSFLAYGASPAETLIVQAAGALYLGFAMTNWMAKDNRIGGIYSRPVAVGNLLHFFAVAMALLKIVFTHHGTSAITVLAAIYAVFAIWFGLVVFTHPLRKESVL
jgi:hypothetical protein